MQPNTPDTVVLKFAAPVLTLPTVKPSGEDGDDTIELAVRPPLSKPGSEYDMEGQAAADLTRKSSSTATHPSPGETSVYDCIQIGSPVICAIWQDTLPQQPQCPSQRSQQAPRAPPAGSVGVSSVGSANASKGKLPDEPVCVARRRNWMEYVSKM